MNFAAICEHISETSIVIVRASDDRFPTLNALVEYGKANESAERKLKASTNGIHASNHIGIQAFANSADFTYTDISQSSTADQLQSLQSGEADFTVVKLQDIAGQENIYRILGVFDTQRLPKLPDVPTLGELGYFSNWLGSARCIVAPAGVSRDIIAFYDAAFKAAMKDPDYLTIAEQVISTTYKNATATDALIRQQQLFAENLTEDFWD